MGSLTVCTEPGDSAEFYNSVPADFPVNTSPGGWYTPRNVAVTNLLLGSPFIYGVYHESCCCKTLKKRSHNFPSRHGAGLAGELGLDLGSHGVCAFCEVSSGDAGPSFYWSFNYYVFIFSWG